MILYKNDNTTRTKAKQDYAWAYIFHHSDFDSHNEGKQSKRFAYGRILRHKKNFSWEAYLYWRNSQPLEEVARSQVCHSTLEQME